MESNITEILSRISLVDLVSDYITLKQRGSEFIALCPFHQEKTPSFTVSPTKNLFYCFGCGKGGNAINFLMESENIDFKEALNILAKKAGIDLSTNEFKPLDKYYKIMKYASDFYHNILLKGRAKNIESYLKRRGIDNEMIVKFKLGAGTEKLIPYLRKENIEFDMLKKTGLLVQQGNSFVERFQERLIFSIFDVHGKVVAFGGRTLGNKNPKYINSPQTEIYNKSQILYGLNFSKKEIRKKRKVILVEGYLDLIALHQFGFSNSVASLGTSFTTSHGKLLKRFTDEVIIIYDYDTAGLTATERAIKILLKEDLDVFICSIPGSKDPDEFLRKNSDSKNKLLSHTISWLDFILQIHKSNTPSEKNNLVSIISDIITSIKNPVLQHEWRKKAAYRTSLNPQYFTEGYTYPVRKTSKMQLTVLSFKNIWHLITSISERDDAAGDEAKSCLEQQISSEDNTLYAENSSLQNEITRLKFCSEEEAKKSLGKYLKRYEDLFAKQKSEAILEKIRRAQNNGKSTRKLEIELEKILRN